MIYSVSRGRDTQSSRLLRADSFPLSISGWTSVVVSTYGLEGACLPPVLFHYLRLSPTHSDPIPDLC